ncbi:prealbumin-like fold domain-containing protein [Bifidobacterium choloepi]|uniref:SpaA-like prealbumin fold domain-containing protein n=1 Tax=Bifidobacterium choloepi TaxID=2614131 RepID=A0A6I5N9B4_9BIFI|nr:prealbumin-like fold domain-containing protein [Bifidobacterium choloepi]NEG70391.1 hypothetical protein [Bifidobacterium choloepi]
MLVVLAVIVAVGMPTLAASGAGAQLGPDTIAEAAVDTDLGQMTESLVEKGQAYADIVGVDEQTGNPDSPDDPDITDGDPDDTNGSDGTDSQDGSVSSDPYDLGQYITSVTLTTSDGRDLLDPDNPVESFSGAVLTLAYQVSADIVTSEHNTFTYQLPDVIELSEAIENEQLVSSGTGITVGYYSVTTDGLVTIVYTYDAYTDHSAAGAVISGAFSVEFEVDETTVSKLNGVEIGSATLETYIKPATDVSVRKTATSVDKDAGTVSYTVKLTSQNGSGGDIDIADIMSDNLQLASEVVIVKTGVDDSSGESFTTTSTQDTMPTTLGELAAGESYEITYTAALAGGVENAATVETVGNTVTVTYPDGGNGTETATDGTTTTLDYRNATVSKTATTTTDADGNAVNVWTITLTGDVAGYLVTDVLAGSALTSAALADGSAIVLAGADGAVIDDTIASLDGYVLPGDLETGTYTITYVTPANTGVGSATTNTVTITPSDAPDYPITTTATAQDGVGVGVTKEAGGATASEDGSTLEIMWTVTIDTTDGALPAGWTLTDSTDYDRHQHGGSAFTKAQFTAFLEALEAALEVDGVESSYSYQVATANYRSYTDIADMDEDDLVDWFEITFDESLPQGVTITLAYATTANAPAVTTTFRNTVQVGANGVTVGSATAEQPVTVTAPAVSKVDLASSYSTSDTTHEYADGLTLSWGIVVSIPSEYPEDGGAITVDEQLPEALRDRLVSIAFMDRYNESGAVNFTVNDGTALASETITFGDGTVTLTTNDDGTLTFVISGELAAQYRNGTLLIAIVCDVPEADGSAEGLESGDDSSGNGATGTTVADGIATATSYENSVTLTSGEGGSSASQTQTVTVPESTTSTRDVLSKSFTGNSTALANNLLPYEVIVNPDAEMLVEGTHVLYFEDVLSYYAFGSNGIKVLNIALVPGSLAVYELNENGDVIRELDSTEYAYTYRQVDPEHTWELTQNIIGIELPDNMALKVVYQYVVTVLSGSGITTLNDRRVSNSVSISGVAETTGESVGATVKQTSAASTHIEGVNAYKVNADDYSIMVADTTFELYRWGVNDAGAEDWIYVGTMTTNESGYMLIAEDAEAGSVVGLATGVAYRLVETESASGYRKSSSPYDFYVYSSVDNATAPTASADYDPTGLILGSAINLENTSTNARIRLEKLWVACELDDDGACVTDIDGTPVKVEVVPSSGSVDVEVTRTKQVFNVTDLEYVSYAVSTDNYYSRGYAVSTVDSGTTVAGSTMTISFSRTTYNPSWNSAYQYFIAVNDGNGYQTVAEGAFDASANGLVTMEATIDLTADTEVLVYTPDGSWSAGELAVTVDSPDVGGQTVEPDESFSQTITIDAAHGWTTLLETLPLLEVDEDAGTTTYYTYTFAEIDESALVRYVDNENVVGGTVQIINYWNDSPDTPDTPDSAAFTLPFAGGNGGDLWLRSLALAGIGFTVLLLERYVHGEPAGRHAAGRVRA